MRSNLSLTSPSVPLIDTLCVISQTLKDRPSPVLLHTRQVGDRFELRIGLNAASLSHVALSQLPAPTLSKWTTTTPKVEWRLTNSGTHGSKLGRQGLSTTFTIKSNRDSPSADQPKKFKAYPLRPEQLRSLHWMVDQEANPKPWIEEEVAEYLLPEMNWHAEARATREVTVRGGVVADAGEFLSLSPLLGSLSVKLLQTKAHSLLLFVFFSRLRKDCYHYRSHLCSSQT